MAKKKIDLNTARWIASCVAVAASLCAAFLPEYRASAAIISAFAGAALGVIAHLTHLRNLRLRAEVAGLQGQVHALGGSIDDLGGAVEANHPSRHVAAAIYGQHELATMGYGDLVKRLQADGYICKD